MTYVNLNLKVLVVDDDDVDRMTINRALRGIVNSTFDVLEVNSVAGALEKIEDQSFDLIFLDYLLPDGTGLSVLEHIQTKDMDTPVIVLTGQGDERLAVELIQAGAADYLPKSHITAETLAFSIKHTLKLRQAEYEKQLALKEIEKKNGLIREILENISDAFFSLDHDWCFTYVNQHAEALLGVQAEKVLGQNAVQSLNNMSTWFMDTLDWGLEGRRIMQCDGYYEAIEKWLEVQVYPAHDGITVYFRDISDRKTHEDRLSYMANYDKLTDLPNRQFVEIAVNKLLETSKLNNEVFSLLFIDLDGFKKVNDTLGHDAGDELLKIVGKRLKRTVRPRDTVARLGGDEFVILLEDVVKRSNVEVVAENVIKAVGHPIKLGDSQGFVTASMGISIYPDDGADKEKLLKNADTAMYEAKQTGKNQYKFYSEELNREVEEKKRMEKELLVAFEENQFLLHYQPQVDINNNMVVGAEALIRWQHPQWGLLDPGEFLPIVFEMKAEGKLSEWVISNAMKDLNSWQALGYEELSVFVNLSGSQLQEPELLDCVSRNMKKYGILAGQFGMEIMEDVTLDENDNSISQLRSLQDMGALIAVDDFGAGYSSLSLLSKLPINVLKIHRSFITDITDNARHAVITKAISDMANGLNLMVVAEGVETQEQFDLIRSFDSHNNIQGFLYCAPVAAGEFIAFLEEVQLQATRVALGK